MNSVEPWSSLDNRAGLLIDTNLLVLFVVGTVNPDRISNFKRTSRYTHSDFDLLCRVIGYFTPLYTLPHVMAEVSNLTDMTGPERLMARLVLKAALETLQEPAVPSILACQNGYYQRLGLVDAAIAAASQEQRCAVLTDDLDLYVALAQQGTAVFNFAHLQAANWGL
ncbi:MAG: hypothetical protein IPP47_06610 [Bryobacterales bacterium]|nr:hypothetical protein [Bryobacterales bacterium]